MLWERDLQLGTGGHRCHEEGNGKIGERFYLLVFKEGGWYKGVGRIDITMDVLKMTLENMILSLLKITHACVYTLKSLNEIMPLGVKTLPPRAIAYLLQITKFPVRGIINHFSGCWLGEFTDFQSNIFFCCCL